jgi:hypothetical protein
LIFRQVFFLEVGIEKAKHKKKGMKTPGYFNN